MSGLRQKALNLLSSAYFFYELLSAFRKAGLVGERRNALVVYVGATSRLLDRPLCLLVKGPSGVGKNLLADTVLGFLPPSEVQQLTSSSTRSWNYLDENLEHKVVYVKERNEIAGSVHPTRLLISEKELVHIVTVKKDGEFVTERRVTKGPIASISTTTQDRVGIDDETRHLSIWADQSPTQTAKIMEATLDDDGGLQPGEREVWHEVQRLIAKRAANLRIDKPDWIKDIVPHVRNDNLRARRYFAAYWSACKTVALIRSFRSQGQVEQEPTSITVRFTDLAIAALIFGPVFEQSLDRASDDDLEVRQCVERLASANGDKAVSARQVALDMGISPDRAYSALRKALEAGSVSRANQPAKSNLKLYLPSKSQPFLPESADLFHKIDGVPTSVKFVHPLTGKWITYDSESENE